MASLSAIPNDDNDGDDDGDDSFVVEEEEYFHEQKDGIENDSNDDNDVDPDFSGVPELTLSETKSRKMPPRKISPPLPSPSRRAREKQETTNNGATDFVAPDKNHDSRLDDLAQSMEDILVRQKKEIINGVEDETADKNLKGFSLLVEDDDTMALLRQAKEKKQYESAAAILEELSRSSPPSVDDESYQEPNDDASRDAMGGLDGDMDYATIQEYAEALPSLQDEEEELIVLLRRAKENRNYTEAAFILESMASSAPLSMEQRSGGDKTEPDPHYSKPPTSEEKYISDYESSSDGSIFLSAEAYRQACNNAANLDGSLNLTKKGPRKSQSQQERIVSQSTLDSIMEGPMAFYGSNNDGDKGSKDEGAEDEVTMVETLEVYRNLDRSLIDGRNGNAVTPAQEALYHKLLAEEELADRAYGDQMADAWDCYTKEYNEEIGLLEQLLDEIQDKLEEQTGTHQGKSEDENSKKGDDNVDVQAGSSNGILDDSEDGQVFFSSSPAGKKLDERIEKDRIEHANNVARYYEEMGESDWEDETFPDKVNT